MIRAPFLYGIVAQLVEQGPFKAKVAGSSPANPTNDNGNSHESGFFICLENGRMIL